jgi:nucleoside-diphosphate-sugar epimerase
VLANLLSLATGNTSAFGRVYNVACGQSFTLNTVIETLGNGLKERGVQPQHTVIYGPKRVGDIRDSLADIGLIERELHYRPMYTFEEGIASYLAFQSA